MSRGGRRQGRQGAKYPNRLDLQMGPRKGPAPVMRVPDQSYGQQSEQVRAQQAVPMGAPPSWTQPAGVAPIVAEPTKIIPFTAPSNRPNEPLTAGVNVGPGPGAPPPPPVIENPERIRPWLPALERLAASPDASTETRNFVRFLRSTV